MNRTEEGRDDLLAALLDPPYRTVRNEARMGIRYYDTRSQGLTPYSFTDVVLRGLADSGGLFVPQSVPHFSREELAALADLPYWQRAATLYRRCEIDLPDPTIDHLMEEAYGDQFAHPAVAPLNQLDEGTYLLELWHGPTSAFKDMALQCMPRFFSAAIEKHQAEGTLTKDVLILVATSGDTGKAALDGYADRPHTSIAVLYPAEGVSDIQRKQMVTQAGDNVVVFGVRGNFDDCQTTAKQVFGDREFAGLLAQRDLQLSSANSINFGRLLPQVAYYLSAVAELIASGRLPEGTEVDVCVPTGNFGNILAAYYAKKMGAPIGKLICASNENDVLADFIRTGTYDISGRNFVVTPSPSMDILVSSNLERLLFELAGPERTAAWMEQLATQGNYTVDAQTLAQIQNLFAGDAVTNDESLRTVREVWDAHGELLDPHTAVAYRVGAAHRSDNPLIVVATAHWAKFAPDVLRGLTGTPAGAQIEGAYAGHTEFDMLRDIAALAPGAAPVPDALAALESAPERFTGVIEPGMEPVERALVRWLDGR